MCNNGNYDNSLLYTIHVMSTFLQIIIENAVFVTYVTRA